jgi:hypothetical protein
MRLSNPRPPMPVANISFRFMAISSTATTQISNNCRIEAWIFCPYTMNPTLDVWRHEPRMVVSKNQPVRKGAASFSPLRPGMRDQYAGDVSDVLKFALSTRPHGRREGAGHRLLHSGRRWQIRRTGISKWRNETAWRAGLIESFAPDSSHYRSVASPRLSKRRSGRRARYYRPSQSIRVPVPNAVAPRWKSVLP